LKDSYTKTADGVYQKMK